MLTSKIVDNGTVNEQNFDQFIKDLGIPRLTKEEQSPLEDDLSIEEIKKALKCFQKNKTPCNDGSTVKFYEMFIDVIGNNMADVDSYNEAFQEDKLSLSQRRGIISLIPN